MTSSLASRPATPHAQAGTHPAGTMRAIAAILREIDAAFEALARRRYDAPWQRTAVPHDCRDERRRAR